MRVAAGIVYTCIGPPKIKIFLHIFFNVKQKVKYVIFGIIYM